MHSVSVNADPDVTPHAKQQASRRRTRQQVLERCVHGGIVGNIVAKVLLARGNVAARRKIRHVFVAEAHRQLAQQVQSRPEARVAVRRRVPHDPRARLENGIVRLKRDVVHAARVCDAVGAHEPRVQVEHARAHRDIVGGADAQNLPRVGSYFSRDVNLAQRRL